MFDAKVRALIVSKPVQLQATTVRKCAWLLEMELLQVYAGLAGWLTCSITLTISLSDPPDDTVEEIVRIALACVGLVDTDASCVSADPIKPPLVGFDTKFFETVTSSTDTVSKAIAEFDAAGFNADTTEIAFDAVCTMAPNCWAIDVPEAELRIKA